MDIRKLFRPDKDKIYDKGVDALKRGNFAGALSHFTRVVQLDQRDAPAWHNLAFCCESVKDYRQAADYYRRYIALDPAGSDPDLPEFIEVLERAARVDSARAEEIIREYRSKLEQTSRETSVGSVQITLDMILKAADGLLFSDEFRRSETVESFGKAMSAKIPLRFYGVKFLENMDPRDAFGFGTAFTAAGYAIARASVELVGRKVYQASVSPEILQELRRALGEKGIPISYNPSVIKRGNAISWQLMKRALDECIESNLAAFLKSLASARAAPQVVREHLVKEFVYTGYYIGLCENTRTEK
jgi:tetratricopeptide (TPR) repeat protein